MICADKRSKEARERSISPEAKRSTMPCWRQSVYRHSGGDSGGARMVSRGGSNLGDATLVLRADRRQLNRDLDRAEQNVERRLENFSRRARVAGTFLAGFGAVVTGGDSPWQQRRPSTTKRALLKSALSRRVLAQRAFSSCLRMSKTSLARWGLPPRNPFLPFIRPLARSVPPENVIDFLRTASKAAIGGITELDVAVKGIAVAVNGYGADVLSCVRGV